MNRDEYLKELKKYLKRLPADDYQNALEYFIEYFDEAGPAREGDAIKELGSPKEAAAELLSALLDEKISVHSQREAAAAQNRRFRAGDKIKAKNSSSMSILLTAFLAVCAAPIAAPFALLILCLLFAGIILVFAAVLCIFLTSGASVIFGIFSIIEGFSIITLSAPGCLVIAGCGLLAVGFGLLFFILGTYICKGIAIGIARFIQWTITKRKVKKDE